MGTANINQDTLGRYRLIEQIGRGGMASVFKAVDPSSGREVAIKVLSPVLAQEEQFTKRFEREAQVVMRLSHPNIVPVVDYGQDGGFAYLVMPLLDVGSLADRLAEGPLTPAEGGRLLTQLSQALEFAHERGVVHRDVKPSNVLLDENGSALLADFGLARIHDASVSLTGSALLGTPAYMSPEQARGEKVGPASDQYSLGVILYQLCTGNLPFEAETPMAVMLKHINEPVPLARESAPNVPEAIEHVILKATAKLPEHRFGSMSELNAAFQAALAHARDPFANPAPRIELPPSTVATSQIDPGPVQIVPNVPKRSPLARLAGAAAVLLLILLACPVAYASYNGMLNDAATPAEGSALGSENMSDPQLTALAGTIAALSTELAAAGDGTLSPELIQTAAMSTMSAVGQPSGTPGLVVIGDGTATSTAAAGPSPSPGFSPTSSYTPSPGPSETPSLTPVPSQTSTAPPSPSASATTNLTQTATSAADLTSTPSASPSPTPSPTDNAAVIPTNSPTLDPCTGLTLGGVTLGPRELHAVIINPGPTAVKIVEIVLEWPSDNEKLKLVELHPSGNPVIWDEGDDEPPSRLPNEGGWTADGDRTIPMAATKELVFVFADEIVSGPYGLTVTFNNGCSVDR